MYLSLPSTFLLVLSIPDLCGRQGAGQAGQGKVTCYGIVWSGMENVFYTSKVLLFLSPAAHKCIKLVYLAASLGDLCLMKNMVEPLDLRHVALNLVFEAFYSISQFTSQILLPKMEKYMLLFIFYTFI